MRKTGISDISFIYKSSVPAAVAGFGQRECIKRGDKWLASKVNKLKRTQ